MNYISKKNKKIQLISKRFKNLIGKPITNYEVVQLHLEEDGEWTDWMDLPVYFNINKSVLSLSWKKFDDLAISNSRELPFSLSGSTIRFVSEGYRNLDPVIGKCIDSVFLGRGDLPIENNPIEIWTRLLIKFTDNTSLEIFNDLDENGIEFHKSNVEGEFIKCI